MSSSDISRQQKSINKKIAGGYQRINTLILGTAKAELDRLIACNAVTKSIPEMLELLIMSQAQIDNVPGPGNSTTGLSEPAQSRLSELADLHGITQDAVLEKLIFAAPAIPAIDTRATAARLLAEAGGDKALALDNYEMEIKAVFPEFIGNRKALAVGGKVERYYRQYESVRATLAKLLTPKQSD